MTLKLGRLKSRTEVHIFMVSHVFQRTYWDPLKTDSYLTRICVRASPEVVISRV